MMTDVGDAGYRFHIQLQLFHPSLSPQVLTDRDSYRLISRTVTGQRRFLRSYLDFMTRYVQPHADFLAGFLGSGGKGVVTIQLPGEINIGDSLPPGEFLGLAKLGLELGIEVFPDMD